MSTREIDSWELYVRDGLCLLEKEISQKNKLKLMIRIYEVKVFTFLLIKQGSNNSVRFQTSIQNLVDEIEKCDDELSISNNQENLPLFFLRRDQHPAILWAKKQGYQFNTVAEKDETVRLSSLPEDITDAWKTIDQNCDTISKFESFMNDDSQYDSDDDSLPDLCGCDCYKCEDKVDPPKLNDVKEDISDFHEDESDSSQGCDSDGDSKDDEQVVYDEEGNEEEEEEVTKDEGQWTWMGKMGR
jgi:hypothetical protein